MADDSGGNMEEEIRAMAAAMIGTIERLRNPVISPIERAGAAVKLFWQFAQPDADQGFGVERSDEEPEEDEETGRVEALVIRGIILALVTEIEGQHRVPIEPDQDPFDVIRHPSLSTRLITAQHLASLLALKSKQTHGVNDDYLAAIQRGTSIGSYLHLEHGSCIGRPSIWVSAKAVHGALLFERFTEMEPGTAAEALSLFTAATRCLADACSGADDDVDESIALGLENYLEGVAVSAQQVADLVEEAFEAKKGSWQQLASDCEYLESLRFWWEDGDEVEHGVDEVDPAFVYFALARDRARQRLDPDQLLEARNQEYEKQAADRLTRYFFDGGLWSRMPKRAQDELIDADQKWFAGKQRIQAILGNLQIAVASICDDMLWTQLIEPHARKADGAWLELLSSSRSKDQQRLGELVLGRPPELLDYQLLLSAHSFSTLAREAGMSPDAIKFLKGLPAELQSLRGLRNPGEHDRKREWDRQEIEPFYRKFIIDARSPGHLPTLVRLWSEWRRGLGER